MAAPAPFRLGLKEIYLPNFTLTLKRTPSQPATSATFLVPLWFSKLDLRDYLHNAYQLRISPAIRSYISQSKIRQGQTNNPSRPQYKRWHRPRATKRMTVEMEQPFVWPEAPKGNALKDWNPAESKMGTMEQEEMQERMGGASDARAVGETRRKAMREQAKALLEGRQRWRPGMDGEKGVGFLGGGR
ncbi:hypothetical protein LTR62_003927 [Meristemomyces frigidus]|uniref:Large ribosomal subunit protein uL23m n=1 Tax=Meristemomyces frigidus TaxID=1508187 RepID=A0AAN7TEZ5_9PEZI|nr:hypothetical protein LTR62_003927 [Meristemomyces frigidus]